MTDNAEVHHPTKGQDANPLTELVENLEKGPGDNPIDMEITLESEDGPWLPFLRRRIPMMLRMSIIYLAVLNVGFDMSIANTTLGMPSFRKYFGYEQSPGVWQISSVHQAGWTGGTAAGQVIMDIPGGWLADRFGRRFTLTLSVIIIIVASTVQVTAQNIAAIIAGKITFGMGSGLYISFCTSYTAELASPRLRGIACMAVNLCIQGGMWVGSGAALGLTQSYPDINDTRSWRYIFAFQYIFAGLYLLGCYWLTESPVFYIHHEKYEKAERSIRELYGDDYDVKRHLAFLVKTSEAERQIRKAGKSISYKELFQGRNLIRMMISACIIAPILMGTAFWPNYQTYYFEMAGVGNAQAMNYGATSVAIGTSILAWFLVESVGRRKLWLLGATGMTIANLIGGFMWIPHNTGNPKMAGKIATAFVFIWNGFYDIGPANMGYAITSEVPSSRVRVRNNAFVHVFSHLTNMVVSYVVPYLYNNDSHSLGLGYRMGFVWAVFGAVIVIWGWFFIPNVAGLNAYEIDQLFESKASPRKFDNAKFDDNDRLVPESVFKTAYAYQELVVWRQVYCEHPRGERVETMGAECCNFEVKRAYVKLRG
ncbi:unnamed protein product [Clonostachys rosea]|uniref:Major facilitator superfamily (MFS) profile domain-containing protein n=1 Tax=Bionectria ochroleuca TaxID=29856 RepID=A0ABY6UVX2_BIOOC|nr:unnamed protein product [Clonostachys rosea]